MDVIFLLAKAKNSAGSFGAVRAGQPAKPRDHRHDRGWPHSDSAASDAGLADKKRWKTVGILHVPDDEELEED